MKKELFISSIILCVFFSMMPINTAYHLENKNNRQSTLEIGHKLFGLVGIVYNNETSTGIPEPEFEGFLINVNATFLGYKDFIAVNFLRPLKFDMIQTNSTLIVKMKIFYGIIHYNASEDISVAVGFATGISWNEM
jgi:hypothetical protein